MSKSKPTTVLDAEGWPRVRTVQIRLCDACLNGDGGECHTPGCALWLNQGPDLGVWPELYVVIEAAP
jgi:hypothetical protein